jgi:hypothetical protein
MVAGRKMSKQKYFIAALIALLIFSLGMVLGMVVDNERFRWVIQKSEEQDVSYQSLQFQYLYLNSVMGSDNESCSVLHAQLEDTLADLGNTLDKLTNYQEDSNLNKEDFNLIKRRYLIDNLEYWLFAEKAKKLCNTDLVSVLYFFSGTKCDICPNQGVVLTYYKKKYEDKLLIFPIDVDLEAKEPIIKILRKRYQVYSYPTIVVEDKKYEGVVEKEKLGEIICGNFMDKEQCSN